MLNGGTARLARPAENRLFNAVLLFFLVALATIAAAWGFERIGGYIPCDLCLKQRWPYYFAVPLAALLLRPAADARPLARWGLAILAVAMAASALLGVYHSGVEWGWWTGPQACAGNIPRGLSPEQLKKYLFGAKMVRCDETAWAMWGISMAGWNAILSAALAFVLASGVASWVRERR